MTEENPFIIVCDECKKKIYPLDNSFILCNNITPANEDLRITLCAECYAHYYYDAVSRTGKFGSGDKE